MLGRLRERARALKTEIHAVSLAARDPRTPWSARVVVLLVAAYALSPIDLIPDFIPVLGYLDDVILVPAGIALAIRLIPPEVMEQARAQARQADLNKGLGMAGAGIIVLLWILAIIICAIFLRALLRKAP
jgi:uncharacterized membrane protein YkvA (DUF1232 family)